MVIPKNTSLLSEKLRLPSPLHGAFAGLSVIQRGVDARSEPGRVLQERLKLRSRPVISQDIRKFPPHFQGWYKKRLGRVHVGCWTPRYSVARQYPSAQTASATWCPPRQTKSVLRASGVDQKEPSCLCLTWTMGCP